MKFKQFIDEGITPIVFHHTSVDKLLSILKDDKFRLGNSLGTKSDQRHDGEKFKPYFLSTSRSKFAGYARGFGNREQVNLVLDGRKFGEKYSASPVDYWGPAFKSPDLDVEQRLSSDESEDRIFSPDPTIPNAQAYIKEIHVLMDKKYILLHTNHDEFDKLGQRDKDFAFSRMRMYTDIAKYANVYGIPVYFYNDYNAFKVMNKQRADSGMKERASRVENIVELFAKDSIKDLSDKADKTRYDLLYHDWNGDAVRGLDTDIHNSKTNETGAMSIAKMVRYMHQFKLRTTSDVIKFLADKWRDRK